MSRGEAIQARARNEALDEGTIKAAPPELNFPELTSDCLDLWELFFLSGQCTKTGMGITELTWAEIESFVRVADIDITFWEIRLLRKMSEAFCSEYSKASDKERKAPYSPEREDETVETLINKALNIRDALSAFKRK